MAQHFIVSITGCTPEEAKDLLADQLDPDNDLVLPSAKVTALRSNWLQDVQNAVLDPGGSDDEHNLLVEVADTIITHENERKIH